MMAGCGHRNRGRVGEMKTLRVLHKLQYCDSMANEMEQFKRKWPLNLVWKSSFFQSSTGQFRM